MVYEKTRDLFEKQRVIDKFLEEHEEDNRVLNKYYQNNYYQGKQNKHYKFLYNNSYELKKIRFSIMSAFASTGIMTGCLCILHPYLMAFAIPDIFYMLAFSRSIANCTVHEMVC